MSDTNINLNFTVINSPKGILNLTITDEFNKPQGNVVYTILNQNKEELADISTEEDGKLTLTNFGCGTFYLKYKSGAPAGVQSSFKNPNNLTEFVISENNFTADVNITYTYYRTNMDASVLDENYDKSLGGVGIVITDLDGNEITRVFTDENGKAQITDLIDGRKYIYKVVSTPEGYDVWKKDDNSGVEYFIANSESEIILFWKKKENTEVTLADIENLIKGDYQINAYENNVNYYYSTKETAVSQYLISAIKQKLLNAGIDLDALGYKINAIEGIYDGVNSTYNIYKGKVTIYDNNDNLLSTIEVGINYLNTNSHTPEEENEYQNFKNQNEFNFTYIEEGINNTDEFYILKDKVNTIANNYNNLRTRAYDFHGIYDVIREDYPFLCFINSKYYGLIYAYLNHIIKVVIPYNVVDENSYILSYLANYYLEKGYIDSKEAIYIQNGKIYLTSTNNQIGKYQAERETGVIYNPVDTNNNYEKESLNDLTIDFDRQIVNVKTLTIDNVLINSNNYHININQLIFNGSFLETLSLGTHQVYLETKSGIGRVEITIIPKQYYYTLGNLAEITTDNTNTIIFRINADLSKFTTVYINNWEVPRDYYELRSGSTIIDFDDDFLKSLEEGTYAIKAIFTDGEALTYFTVTKEKEQTPSKHKTNIITDRVDYHTPNIKTGSNKSDTKKFKNAKTSTFGIPSSTNNTITNNKTTILLGFIVINILLSLLLIKITKDKIKAN